MLCLIWQWPFSATQHLLLFVIVQCTNVEAFLAAFGITDVFTAEDAKTAQAGTEC
jgi:hypothetical protein